MAAGAVSLKNLTKREEVRKGADQAICKKRGDIGISNNINPTTY